MKELNYKKLLVVTSILFQISCVCMAQKSHKYDGAYVDTCAHYRELKISQERFAYVETWNHHGVGPYCCDTMAYGSISTYDSTYLLLASDLPFYNSPIDMVVAEAHNPKADSIEFVINNPIEVEEFKERPPSSDLSYFLDASPFSDEPNGYQKSVFKISNWGTKGSIAFRLKVHANSELPVKHLQVFDLWTREYKVKDKGANLFVINLPQLNYVFFNTERFEGELAKIIDDHTIFWRGEIFKKK